MPISAKDTQNKGPSDTGKQNDGSQNDTVQRGPNLPGLLQRAQRAPNTLTPQDARILQRTIGNRATARLLQPVLQAKLQLGPAGDRYEQEADRVADQVVRSMQSSPPVQRDGMEEEEMIQSKGLPGPQPAIARSITPVQRAPITFQKPKPAPSTVQRDAAEGAMHGPEGGDVDASVAQQIQQARGGGQPLDEGVRRSMEQGFGVTFGNVRIHTGATADTLNRSLNAKAFTAGNDIFFGKGQYNPGSTGGQKLLAHELTHTVQQTGGAGVQRRASGQQPVVQRFLSKLFGKKKTDKKKSNDKPKESSTEATSGTQQKQDPPKPTNESLQDSIKYERNLGFYAFNHGRANRAAAVMVDRMITALIGEFDASDQKNQQQLVDAFGSTRQGKESSAGQVRATFSDVWGALKEGNLRERLTALMNAMFGAFKTEVKRLMDASAWEEMKAKGLNVPKLQRRKRQMKFNVGAKDLYRDPGNPLDRKSFGNYEHTGTTRDANKGFSDRTVGDLEKGPFKAGLSEREKALQFPDKEDDEIEDEKLKWQEGGTYWKIRQDNKWVKKIMDGLHMPVIAGPSGTMLRMFQIWEYLNKPVPAEDWRLAVMAWMLTSNDHSFHEMMLTASWFGLPYTPGLKSYRQIAPLNESELRDNVAVDRTFPDEWAFVRKMKAGKFNLITEEQQQEAEGFDNQDDEFDHLSSDLSEGQRAAITALLSYTDEDPSSYKFMNNALKGGAFLKPAFAKFIKEDSYLSDKYNNKEFTVNELIKEAGELSEMAMQGMSLLKPYTKKTYRGWKAFKLPKKGAEFAEKKFSSTSTEESVAEGFAGKGMGFYKVVATIDGKSGRQLGNVSMMGASEGEVLFPPGVRFKITSKPKKDDEGYYRTEMTEVSAPKKDEQSLGMDVPDLKHVTWSPPQVPTVSQSVVSPQKVEESDSSGDESQSTTPKLPLKYYDGNDTYLGDIDDPSQLIDVESGSTTQPDSEGIVWQEVITKDLGLVWTKKHELDVFLGKPVKSTSTPVTTSDSSDSGLSKSVPDSGQIKDESTPQSKKKVSGPLNYYLDIEASDGGYVAGSFSDPSQITYADDSYDTDWVEVASPSGIAYVKKSEYEAFIQ